MTTRRVRITSYRGKAVSIKYSECVSAALGIQHATRMSRIISHITWPVRLYHIFPHYLINDFRKNVKEHKMCVSNFSANFSETFLILRNLLRDIIIDVRVFERKVPVLVVRS